MRSRCAMDCICLTGMAASMLCSLLQVMERMHRSGFFQLADKRFLHMHETQLMQLPQIQLMNNNDKHHFSLSLCCIHSIVK